MLITSLLEEKMIFIYK